MQLSAFHPKCHILLAGLAAAAQTPLLKSLSILERRKWFPWQVNSWTFLFSIVDAILRSKQGQRGFKGLLKKFGSSDPSSSPFHPMLEITEFFIQCFSTSGLPNPGFSGLPTSLSGSAAGRFCSGTLEIASHLNNNNHNQQQQQQQQPTTNNQPTTSKSCDVCHSFSTSRAIFRASKVLANCCLTACSQPTEHVATLRGDKELT